jgi:hypothetical protein
MNATDTAAFVAASQRLHTATSAAIRDGRPLEEDFDVQREQATILNLFDREAESRKVRPAA